MCVCVCICFSRWHHNRLIQDFRDEWRTVWSYPEEASVLSTEKKKLTIGCIFYLLNWWLQFRSMTNNQCKEVLYRIYWWHRTFEYSVKTSELNLLTFCINWSWQTIRILSGTAGVSSLNTLDKLASSRAEVMASLTANNTDADKNRGGSPTALG